MNLHEYVAGALLTESKIDSVVIDKQHLQLIMEIYIEAGNILDQYKKHIFYNRTIDNEKMFNGIEKITDNAALMGLEIPFANFNNTQRAETLDIDPRLFHGILGKATESVELMESIINFSGNYDVYNICEELGDDSWYTAILTDALHVDWYDDILAPNFLKLEARYGEGFTEHAAINRNLNIEREILEDIDINKNSDGF